MKNLIVITAFLNVLASGFVYAADEDALTFKVTNPTRSYGIHVGDILKRSIEINARANQKIEEKSLPLKGARVNGVELVDVKIISKETDNKLVHSIVLAYQVFADANVPTVMAIPEESIELAGSAKVTVPAWHFWFSPLVATKYDNVLPNLQPQEKVPLISLEDHQSRLFVYLTMLAIGLIGTVYVNADKQWLPFMGGNFAIAHRKIKKVAKSHEQDAIKVRKALLSLHQAFNRAYGKNLFAQDVDDFTNQYPGFKKLATDITQFLEASNQTLFSKHPHDQSALVTNLVGLSKRLRDCERGI